MLERQLSAKPLYVRLREKLIDRIAAGDWKSGDLLPNEMELAAEYGLSPGTVRKAMEWLEAAQVVVRRQGRGTYVHDCNAEFVAQRYNHLHSDDNNVVIGEPVPGNVTYGEASARECEQLRLRPQALVRRAERLRARAGRTYAIELAVVPSELFEVEAADRAKDLSLWDLCRRCKILVGEGQERVRAEVATAELAEKLGCKVGEPLFAFERVLMDLSGRPIEYKTGYWYLPGGYYATAVGQLKAVE